MGCDPSLTSGQAGLSWSGKLMPGCDSGPNSALSAANRDLGSELLCVCEGRVRPLLPVAGFHLGVLSL